MRYFLINCPDRRLGLICIALLLVLCFSPAVLPQNGGGTLGKVENNKRPPNAVSRALP